jgi:WD40 repeat protein
MKVLFFVSFILFRSISFSADKVCIKALSGGARPVTDGIADSTAGAGSESDARLQTANLEAAIKELAQAKIDLEDARITGSMPQINLMTFEQDITRKEADLIAAIGLENYNSLINKYLGNAAENSNTEAQKQQEVITTKKTQEYKKLAGYTKMKSFADFNGLRTPTEFSRDGKMFLIVDAKNNILVYDSETLKLLNKFSWKPKAPPIPRFSPDNKFVAASEGGQALKVYDLQKNKLGENYSTLNATSYFVISPNSEQIAVSALDHVSVVNRVTKTSKRLFKKSGANTDVVKKIQYSHDGAYIGVGLNNGKVIIYSTSDLKPILIFEKPHGLDAYGFQFSPNNKEIMIPRFIVSSANAIAYVYNIKTGKKVSTIYASDENQASNTDNYISDTTYSPDGKTIASNITLNKSIEFIDTASGKVINSIDLPVIDGEDISSIKYNQAGTHIVVATKQGQAFVIELSTRIIVTILASKIMLHSAELNFDNSRIIIQIADPSDTKNNPETQIWRPQTAEEFFEAVAQ